MLPACPTRKSPGIGPPGQIRLGRQPIEKMLREPAAVVVARAKEEDLLHAVHYPATRTVWVGAGCRCHQIRRSEFPLPLAARGLFPSWEAQI